MATGGSFQQPIQPDVLSGYNYSTKFPQSSSWSPPSRDRRASNSFPGSIRRIRQACTNCRHRKIKCSGEKPRCVNCRKVDRVCQYAPYSATSGTNVTSPPSSAARSDISEVLSLTKNGSINPELLNRIKTIEAQLAQLTSQTAVPSTKNDEHAQDHAPSLSTMDKSPRNVVDGNNRSESSDSPGSAQSFQPSTETSLHSSLLPSALPVPVMDELVNAYFRHSHNQPYSYFHEASFRERFAFGLLPKCLIYAVFASAIRFVDLDYFRGTSVQAIDEYARSAWLSILTDHMVSENCPNLYVAQATNMLAIVDFTAGRTSSGWLKIGLAVRIAQDLQLMHEPKSTLRLTASEEEERRRTFWSIYLLDKLVSCGQGRPPAIADEDCHVQLPCTQDAFNSGIIPKTADTLHTLLGWNTTPDRASSLGSAFSLVVLSASALGRCARYGLHQRDVQDALPWDSKSEFASHGSTLLLVENHLQAEMQPIASLADLHRRPDGTVDHDVTSHIVFARTLYHLAYCLLNHSFLLRLRVQKLKCRTPPNFLSQASEVCLKHARGLIELLSGAAATGLHVQSSFYAYSIAVAGGLLSVGANEARLSQIEPDSKTVAAHQLSLSMLQEIGQIWEHASKMYFQLLLFDTQGLSLTQSLINYAGQEMNPVVEAVFWSMVNYDTMCNSIGPVETLLGSVPLDEVSTQMTDHLLDQVTLPGAVDLTMGFSSDTECFSVAGADAEDPSASYPLF